MTKLFSTLLSYWRSPSFRFFKGLLYFGLTAIALIYGCSASWLNQHVSLSAQYHWYWAPALAQLLHLDGELYSLKISLVSWLLLFFLLPFVLFLLPRLRQYVLLPFLFLWSLLAGTVWKISRVYYQGKTEILFQWPWDSQAVLRRLWTPSDKATIIQEKLRMLHENSHLSHSILEPGPLEELAASLQSRQEIEALVQALFTQAYEKLEMAPALVSEALPFFSDPLVQAAAVVMLVALGLLLFCVLRGSSSTPVSPESTPELESPERLLALAQQRQSVTSAFQKIQELTVPSRPVPKILELRELREQAAVLHTTVVNYETEDTRLAQLALLRQQFQEEAQGIHPLVPPTPLQARSLVHFWRRLRYHWEVPDYQLLSEDGTPPSLEQQYGSAVIRNSYFTAMKIVKALFTGEAEYIVERRLQEILEEGVDASKPEAQIEAELTQTAAAGEVYKAAYGAHYGHDVAYQFALDEDHGGARWGLNAQHVLVHTWAKEDANKSKEVLADIAAAWGKELHPAIKDRVPPPPPFDS